MTEQTDEQTDPRSAMPRVITLAATKGGVGKTTLAIHVGVLLEQRGLGPVAWLDLDPQGSLSDFYNRRTGSTATPETAPSDEAADGSAEMISEGPLLLQIEEPWYEATYRHLNSLGYSDAQVDADPALSKGGALAVLPSVLKDVLRTAAAANVATVVIDTPPQYKEVIEQAIAVADLTIVPCQPSPMDLAAIDPTLAMLRRHRKAFVFAVTRTRGRSRLAAMAPEALGDHGRVLRTSISDRQAYQKAVALGQAATEFDEDRTLQLEMMGFIDEILSILAEDNLRHLTSLSADLAAE